MAIKRKRRLSPIHPDQQIDYKNIDMLRSFISISGKILSRRSTNLTPKQQRQLAKAVKRARILNLFTASEKEE